MKGWIRLELVNADLPCVVARCTGDQTAMDGILQYCDSVGAVKQAIRSYVVSGEWRIGQDPRTNELRYVWNITDSDCLPPPEPNYG